MFLLNVLCVALLCVLEEAKSTAGHSVFPVWLLAFT